MGLEPATYSLRMNCSTNWAKEANRFTILKICFLQFLNAAQIYTFFGFQISFPAKEFTFIKIRPVLIGLLYLCITDKKRTKWTHIAPSPL